MFSDFNVGLIRERVVNSRAKRLYCIAMTCFFCILIKSMKLIVKEILKISKYVEC